MSDRPQTDAERDAEARGRFLILTLLRFSGVAFAAFGIALMVGRLTLIGDGIDRYVGFALALLGAGDVIVIPALMARKWKSGSGDL